MIFGAPQMTKDRLFRLWQQSAFVLSIQILSLDMMLSSIASYYSRSISRQYQHCTRIRQIQQFSCYSLSLTSTNIFGKRPDTQESKEQFRIHRHFTTTLPRDAMATNIEDALQQGELFTDHQAYQFLKLPTASIAKAADAIAACSHFRALMIDKDEITVMMTVQDYQIHEQSLLRDDVEVGRFTYRLITFDVVLDPTLIGFMAHITKALAAAKVSVLPFSAYSRDHIFVSEADFEAAMQVLEALTKKKSENSTS
jgi:hypothetical protein